MKLVWEINTQSGWGWGRGGLGRGWPAQLVGGDLASRWGQQQVVSTEPPRARTFPGPLMGPQSRDVAALGSGFQRRLQLAGAATGLTRRNPNAEPGCPDHRVPSARWPGCLRVAPGLLCSPQCPSAQEWPSNPPEKGPQHEPLVSPDHVPPTGSFPRGHLATWPTHRALGAHCSAATSGSCGARGRVSTPRLPAIHPIWTVG